jgi:hypothetical protein
MLTRPTREPSRTTDSADPTDVAVRTAAHRTTNGRKADRTSDLVSTTYSLVESAEV